MYQRQQSRVGHFVTMAGLLEREREREAQAQSNRQTGVAGGSIVNSSIVRLFKESTAALLAS